MKRILHALLLAFFTAPLPAFVEEGGAEQRVYEVFLHSLSLLPEALQEEECQRFLTQYPDSVYASEVELRLAQIKAGSSTAGAALEERRLGLAGGYER
jgi:hypothetical protein